MNNNGYAYFYTILDTTFRYYLWYHAYHVPLRYPLGYHSLHYLRGNTKRAFTKWSKQPRAFPVTAIAKLISLPRYTTRYSRQWRTDRTRDVNNMGPL